MCAFVLPARLIVSVLSVEFTEPRAAQITADQIKYQSGRLSHSPHCPHPPRPHPSFIILMILSVFPPCCFIFHSLPPFLLPPSSFLSLYLGCRSRNHSLPLYSFISTSSISFFTASASFLPLSPPSHPPPPLPPSSCLPVFFPPPLPHRPPTSSPSSSIISSCNHLCFPTSSTKTHFNLSLHLSLLPRSLHPARPAAGLLEPGRRGPVAAVGREGVRPTPHHQRFLPDERQSLAAAHQGGLPLPLAPLRYPPPPSHFSRGTFVEKCPLETALDLKCEEFCADRRF